MSVVDELRFLCHWAALNGRFTFMPSSVLPGYRFRNWKIRVLLLLPDSCSSHTRDSSDWCWCNSTPSDTGYSDSD